MTLMQLTKEIEAELRDNLIPFWEKEITDIVKVKGVAESNGDGRILTTAIVLWSFSSLYFLFSKKRHCVQANKLYDYLRDFFYDPEFGGVYWRLDDKGVPIETKKQVSGQAITINALAEYYKATGDRDALCDAIEIFKLLELYSFEQQDTTYKRVFDREWGEITGRRESIDAHISFGVHNHLDLIDAYANLLSVWSNNKLKSRLNSLIKIFCRRLADSETFKVNSQFDEYDLGNKTISFGQDIQTSWLLARAARCIDDASFQDEIDQVSLKIADKVFRRGISKYDGILHERTNGTIDSDVYGWTQAEAIIGFINAYQLSGNKEYLECVVRLWRYLKENIVDPVRGGWHFRVDIKGKPYMQKTRSDRWEASYHQMRACMEVIRRSGDQPCQ